MTIPPNPELPAALALLDFTVLCAGCGTLANVAHTHRLVRHVCEACARKAHTSKGDALLIRVLAAFRERKIIALPSDLFADINKHLDEVDA